MVITASDSNSTLLDVHDNGAGDGDGLQTLKGGHCQRDGIVETRTHSGLRKTMLCVSDRRDNSNRHDQDSNSNTAFLCLPHSSEEALRADHSVAAVPALVESSRQLLARPVRFFSSAAKERLLYVGQGEAAHTDPTQCDVIVSDKATTCHILAIRSVSYDEAGVDRRVLASLAHIDGTGYENDIREMVRRHRTFHNESDMRRPQNMTDIEVHLVGGYDDESGTSPEISTFVLGTLASIADEEKDRMRLHLVTCAVSCLNDAGDRSPVGRGLAMDVATGDVVLARVHRDVAGPCRELRSARLCSGNGGGQFTYIHDVESDGVVSIDPFFFEATKDLNMILTLPDETLLSCLSTSPDVEEEDFCDELRRTFSFMLRVCCHSVFGEDLSKPVQYRRIGTNGWKPV